MGTNVKRSFSRIKLRNDFQARLINGTFRLLGVLEGNSDLGGVGKWNCSLKPETYLIAEFGSLILLESSFWLSEVVFDQVQEHRIIVFGDTGIMN